MTRADDRPAARRPRGALGGLATEAVRDELRDLDLRSTPELVDLVLAEQHAVQQALEHAADALARAVDGVAERLQRGGRLIYVGAGTSGRLAAVDAAECPPTYGVPDGMVVALPAGGAGALTSARESSEDDRSSAVTALDSVAAGPDDAVVGLAASGRTPYVAEGLVEARRRGALTVAVSNNVGAEISALADIALEVPTGAEMVAGSTRLKAGTAQKIVLGALSTLVMVRLGRTYGTLMVGVRATNDKLRDRARRIVVEATGADPGDAGRALDAADGDVQTAIVMILAGAAVDDARARLAERGSVRAALA